jgi:hypothetical protein
MLANGCKISTPNHFHGVVEIVGALLAAPKMNTDLNHGAANINSGAANINSGAANINSGAANGNSGAANGNSGAASSAPTLGKILRRFKSLSAIAVNRCLFRQGQPVWQRNYYEHIISNESAYLKIAEYMQTNPLQWRDDTYYLRTN